MVHAWCERQGLECGLEPGDDDVVWDEPASLRLRQRGGQRESECGGGDDSVALVDPAEPLSADCEKRHLRAYFQVRRCVSQVHTTSLCFRSGHEGLMSALSLVSIRSRALDWDMCVPCRSGRQKANSTEYSRSTRTSIPDSYGSRPYSCYRRSSKGSRARAQ